MDDQNDPKIRAASGGTPISRNSDTDPQLAFLQGLVAEHATVAGDVLELDDHTWAIHGTIAVDGDVIMAEYDTEARAHLVLDELSKPTSL